MTLTQDQQKAITTFNEFLNDGNAFDMFITGTAGTGKTTVLNNIVQYCLDKKIPTVVCAFTHKAANVLKDKLPEAADIQTLHKFLRKRPGVNENAKHTQKLKITTQFGQPAPVRLLIVDEFSMVGEADVMSIGELQDPEYRGVPKMKVLYVGDPKQLPPVGQAQILSPDNCTYKVHLKQVMRNGGPLLEKIREVISMLEGQPPHYLEPNEAVYRDTNIVEAFVKSASDDKIMLAYTNKRVEELNKQLYELLPSTTLRWSPSLRAELEPMFDIEDSSIVTEIQTYSGPLTLNSKFNTLEHLIKISSHYNIKFGRFMNLTEEKEHTYAYIFGHGQFNDTLKALEQAAAESNKLVPSPMPKQYCLAHPHCKECRARAKAWRDYLTIKDCVICIDYPWAQTVHKSQGSTFEEVYIDNDNLSIVLQRDLKSYLRLLYVAMSRAANLVYLNN